MTTNPHNEEAERACLACYLQEPTLLESDALPVDSFYLPTLRAIYESMRACDGALDAVTLNTQLAKDGMLEMVGGPVAVSQILTAVATVGMFDHYKQTVLDLHKRRSIIAAAEAMAKGARDIDAPLQGVSAAADQAITRICTDTQPAAVDLRSLCLQAGERYEKYQMADDGIPGVPIGIPKLDAALGGLRPGEVMVIGARPGYGKTSLLLDMTRHACTQGHPVGLFSAEMPGWLLVDRLVAQQGKISGNPLRGVRKLQDGEMRRLPNALCEISNLPLHIDDSPALDTAQIRSRARQWKREHGIELIVADYLQLFRSSESGKDAGTVERVKEVSACFRELAKELEVPIIILAQLGRDADGKTASEMHMGHFQWASQIEQDATVCAVIGEPGFVPAEIEEETEEYKILDFGFLKSRSAKRPLVALKFWKELTTFEEV